MAAGRAGDRREQIAEIMRCTSLNAAGSELLAVLLTDLDGRRSRPGGRWDVGIGLGSVVLLAGVALLNADPALPFAARLWILAAVQAGVVLAYLMFTATGLWTGRGRPESRAAIQIFTILEKLTPNSRSTDSTHPQQRWKNTDFRGEIAADLERAAILVERIPLAWRGLAPAVRAETLRVSRAKADGLRELQLRTVTPTDSTLTDLVGQLNVALRRLIDGRWHDPAGPAIRRATGHGPVAGTPVGGYHGGGNGGADRLLRETRPGGPDADHTGQRHRYRVAAPGRGLHADTRADHRGGRLDPRGKPTSRLIHDPTAHDVCHSAHVMLAFDATSALAQKLADVLIKSSADLSNDQGSKKLRDNLRTVLNGTCIPGASGYVSFNGFGGGANRLIMIRELDFIEIGGEMTSTVLTTL